MRRKRHAIAGLSARTVLGALAALVSMASTQAMAQTPTPTPTPVVIFQRSSGTLGWEDRVNNITYAHNPVANRDEWQIAYMEWVDQNEGAHVFGITATSVAGLASSTPVTLSDWSGIPGILCVRENWFAHREDASAAGVGPMDSSWSERNLTLPGGNCGGYIAGLESMCSSHDNNGDPLMVWVGPTYNNQSYIGVASTSALQDCQYLGVYSKQLSGYETVTAGTPDWRYCRITQSPGYSWVAYLLPKSSDLDNDSLYYHEKTTSNWSTANYVGPITKAVGGRNVALADGAGDAGALVWTSTTPPPGIGANLHLRGLGDIATTLNLTVDYDQFWTYTGICRPDVEVYVDSNGDTLVYVVWEATRHMTGDPPPPPVTVVRHAKYIWNTSTQTLDVVPGWSPAELTPGGFPDVEKDFSGNVHVFYITWNPNGNIELHSMPVYSVPSPTPTPTPSPTPTINNECAGAVTLSNGTPRDFGPDLTGATLSPSVPVCLGFTPAADVWYQITPNAYANVDVEAQGDLPGVSFAVYQGTCDSLTLIDCANPISQGGTYSLLSAPGITYYLRLSIQYPAATGGTITATWVTATPSPSPSPSPSPTPVPDGDSPATAIEIDCGYESPTPTNLMTGMTASGVDCDCLTYPFPSNLRDKWYKLDSPGLEQGINVYFVDANQSPIPGAHVAIYVEHANELGTLHIKNCGEYYTSYVPLSTTDTIYIRIGTTYDYSNELIQVSCFNKLGWEGY